MTNELNKSPPQHTVLPWHYDPQTKEIYILDDENEPCDVIADMETFKTPLDKAHTNGEFIARACSSHYELLAALERWEQYARDNGYEDTNSGSYCSLLYGTRAIIAKARGQQ